MTSPGLIESVAIGNHRIQRCDGKRMLVIDHVTIITFTQTEYKLLLPLLQGKPTADDYLINDAFGCTVNQWSQNKLDKYIDKLRFKLYPADLKVGRIAKYGHILFAP